MSPNIDRRLTLSIPHNSLPPNPLRVHLLEHFDTLSVYRGSLYQPAARARAACSAKLQRLCRHEKSNNPEIQVSHHRKHGNATHSTPAPTLQRFNGFRRVKPS